MNNSDLARIYFEHHAHETDRRSCRRLAELMRQADKHAQSCDTPGCPMNLRSFIHGDVILHMSITEGFLKAREMVDTTPLEDDDFRRQKVAGRYLVRVFFQDKRRALTAEAKV